jgi:hypothetical protein
MLKVKRLKISLESNNTIFVKVNLLPWKYRCIFVLEPDINNGIPTTLSVNVTDIWNLFISKYITRRIAYVFKDFRIIKKKLD